MSYVTVMPGEPIPEASAWPNLKSHIRQKFVKWDPRQECYIALKMQKIKRSGPAPEVKKAETKMETVTKEVAEEKPKKRGRPKRKKVELD